jgi:2-methylisocitrate lyase-like PEP mutase family enzyme
VKTPHKTAQLRSAISAGCIVMPGAVNAATARLIERIGFPAVYVSGAGLANATAGVPDIGLLTLTEVAQLAGYIARAVKIPALVDADTRFGGPANAAHVVREFERAGLAGMHIEVQVFPKRCGHLAGKAVISVEEMTERIRAAAGARADEDSLSSLARMLERSRVSTPPSSVRGLISQPEPTPSFPRLWKPRASFTISPAESKRR